MLCHVAASQDDTCLDVHAKWLKLGNRWLEEFPWLDRKRDGSGRVVLAFCKACKLYGDFHAEFRTCKSLQKSHFEEHSKTKRHQAAVSNPDIRLGIVAPPVPVFVEALQLVRQGKAGGPQGTKTLKREKLLKAKFCLAEALRIQSRLRLLGAIVLPYIQMIQREGWCCEARAAGRSSNLCMSCSGARNWRNSTLRGS